MSSSIPIIQLLTSISSSPNYCKPINLYSKMQHYSDFKCEYESISNNIQIAPPYVWLNIEESKCFSSIKNDIQRSRVTKEGLLSTNMKGHVLNRISYQQRQEDMGTVQQTQQSLCVAFAVVKDSCEQFLKLIGSELRACLVSKSSLVDRSHLKISQLDEISKQINSKFRIFLIFDTKSQPGRVVCFHSCFYPNVHFKLEKIKTKQGAKFGPNESLQQIQRGQLLNVYGFLTLDSKKRLLIIKKDDPELREDNIIGIWVISTYYSNRTKKQFSKQDAIWIALLDFYTNQQIRKKLSIICKNKGFLCYFGFKKERNKLDSPQFYLFQPNLKYQPKWSFAIKNQVLSQFNKSCQIKFQFINSMIVQQREYSQISDQNHSYEEQNRVKNQSLARKQPERQNDKTFAPKNQANQTVPRGSSQNRNEKKNQEQDQKTKTIIQLRIELEKYKQRCLQLEALNKVLMQQKIMMNSMIQSNQYSMMSQVPQGFNYQYGSQLMNYPYHHLSYSQVGPQNYPPPNQVQANFIDQVAKTNFTQSPATMQTLPQPISASQQANNILTQLPKPNPNLVKNLQQLPKHKNQQPEKLVFSFSSVKYSELTFGTSAPNDISNKNKNFIKKSHSFEPEANNQIMKDVKQNSQTNKIQVQNVNFRKDVRNISFQDSFAQYHSDGQDQTPAFKDRFQFLSKQLQRPLKNQQFGSGVKNTQSDSFDKKYVENQTFRSPQFKRISSDKNQSNKPGVTINKKQQRKFESNNITREYTQIDSKQTTNNNLPEAKQFAAIQPKEVVKQDKLLKKFPSKQYENSSDEQDEQFMKLIQHQKKQSTSKSKAIVAETRKQTKKPKKVSSSDDSDQDLDMKKMRELYLKR